jgi:nucleoside-diphosphate-sugar epimerase
MNKVLILGGNGYIGTYLTELLEEAKIDVTAYGSRTKDYNRLDASFISNFRTVILLAGHSSVQMCAGDLKSPWNNNVRNFDNLVQKLDEHQRLIYASSSSVYGNKGEKVYTEQDINLEFVNNYDLTKVSLDLLAQKYMSQGRDIIGLRFGTVNGGSPVIRRDLMLNSMMYSAMFRGNITVNNKHVRRPILSIKDLGRAIITILDAATHGIAPSQNRIYNLASFNSTVEEMAGLVSDITGVKIVDTGTKPGVYDFETSTSKFEKHYGFKFLDTAESIILDIRDRYKMPRCEIVTRSEYFKYEN